MDKKVGELGEEKAHLSGSGMTHPTRRKKAGDLGPGARVFGYLRASPGPLQERSTTDQRRELEAFAIARGWTVVAWYEDDDRSGSSAWARPEFLDMIATAKAEPRPVDVILVWSFSRFSRNQIEAQYFTAELEIRGVKLVSVSEEIPAEFGEIYRSLIRWKDEAKLEELRVGVRRGHRANLARGYMPGGNPPLGYKAVREQLGTHRNGSPRYGMRWEIDETVAPLVREAFMLRARGATVQSLLRDGHLHTTRQGLHTMFNNPAYKGVYKYGDEEYPGAVPAIVETEVWERCQHIDQKEHPRRIASSFLLSGLLRCGYCGAAMSGMSSRKTLSNGQPWSKRYYICGGRNAKLSCPAPIKGADDIEQDVMDTVFGLLTPEAFAQVVAEVAASRGAGETLARQQRLDRDIAQGERALADLLELAGSGLTMSVLSARLHSKEAEVQTLKAERARLVETSPLLTASADQVSGFVNDLRLRLESSDIAVRRFALKELIASLSYGPELKITYKLSE